MQVNKRTFYEPKFEVEVLDAVRAQGSVPPVAASYRLEPSLIYSWKAKENEIRSSFGPMSREAPKPEAPAKQQSLKLIEPPPAADFAAEKPKKGKARPDGPKLVTRGLGEWLRKVVREELDEELPKVLEERLALLVDDLVEKKLEAMFSARRKQDAG